MQHDFVFNPVNVSRDPAAANADIYDMSIIDARRFMNDPNINPLYSGIIHEISQNPNARVFFIDGFNLLRNSNFCGRAATLVRSDDPNLQKSYTIELLLQSLLHADTVEQKFLPNGRLAQKSVLDVLKSQTPPPPIQDHRIVLDIMHNFLIQLLLEFFQPSQSGQQHYFILTSKPPRRGSDYIHIFENRNVKVVLLQVYSNPQPVFFTQ